MLAVNLQNPFILIFLFGTLITFTVNQVLEFLDYSARKKNGNQVPEVLKKFGSVSEVFDSKKLEDISSYENAKYFLWIPKSIFSCLLIISLVLFGFYPWVYELSVRITGTPHNFWSLFFCFFIFNIISGIPESIIDLPFSLYREFSIEKRFGFSKMTFKLWIIDFIKDFFISLVMSLFLGLCITLALTFFVKTWWLIVSFVILAFVMLMQVIYPKFIAPVFNKFEPLPDGELKQKLEELLFKIGFKNDGLFVMDASKRSGHSNAYFSGFGKSKRIVLYDTLITQLTVDELVAVLGHELGHFKLKHILKNLLKSIPLIFIMTFGLFYFSQMDSLYSGFGFDINKSDIRWVQFIGINLIQIVWASVSEILTPISNISSRKHEYEADKFARDILGKSKDLICGLIKLNSENLSELFPPDIYVWWNYSHPTLVQRIKALEEKR